jgi:hypothetical protein
MGVSMKSVLMLLVLSSLFTGMAYAEGESETECPMMAELTLRSNPKLSIDDKKTHVEKPVEPGSTKQ